MTDLETADFQRRPRMTEEQLRSRIRDQLVVLWNHAILNGAEIDRVVQPHRDIADTTDQIMAMVALAHPDTNHVHHPRPERTETNDAERGPDSGAL